MQLYLKIIFSFLAILAGVLLSEAGDAAAERRLALVIGNGSYKTKPLATAVNDAALIAQTLQLAGFDVTGVRDLDQSLLHKTIRDFTDKVANTGPGAVIVVYFSGYGVQSAGENFLIPVGTEFSEVAELSARTLSLSELMHAFAALNSKSTFIVLDAARPGPFVLPGQPGGLAWTEPEANMLIAFSSAPGTSARDAAEGYGPYAKALAEMIREGDLAPSNVFDLVRLRVHELTRGAQIPWNASKIEAQFKFFETTLSASGRRDMPARAAWLRSQPMGALGVQNAYGVALMRDTFDAYTDFLANYWQDPTTKRVRALLAARRESITWQRTCQVNKAAAYWSYLERYPRGLHAGEAGRLLKGLGAATTPPPKFVKTNYDVPPPLPDEMDYVERPVLILDDPAFGFEPPPPSPSNILEPPPEEIVRLTPVPVVSAAHALPAPAALPLPVFLRVPTEAMASPNPSFVNSGREALSMRPAIDLPIEPDRPAASSPISSPSAFGTTNDLAGVVHATPPVGGEATSTTNPSSPSENQDVSQRFTSRLTSIRTTPTAPAWFTDIVTKGSQDILPRMSVAENEMPTSAPSMFAPASAGLTLQTWDDDRMLSSQATRQASPLTASPASPLQSRVELPGQISSAATEAIPPSSSTERSGKSAAVVVGSFSMPGMNSEARLSPPSASQETVEEKTPPLTLPVQTASVTPAWLTDVVTARNLIISSRQPLIDSEALTSIPSMFASASAGLMFQTWRYGIWSQKSSPAWVPTNPASFAKPRAGLPGQVPTPPLRQTSGSVPSSTARSAKLTPAVTGSIAKPNANIAAPSTAANQPKQRKNSLTGKLAPPEQAASTSREVPKTQPPNPQ
jgi:uncharacterized caspase-like protein